MLDSGVTVDRYMQTSAPDVYAAGDVTGIATTWYAAVKQGRIAGQNMANPGSALYEDKLHAASTINYFGLTSMSVGKVTPPFDDCEVHDYDFGGKHLKLVIKDGIAKGALLFGDISNAGHWKYMIHNAIPLNNIGKLPIFAEYADFFEIDPDTAEFRYKLSDDAPPSTSSDSLLPQDKKWATHYKLADYTVEQRF